LFLANDGVRGVFRTQQDKLQLGASYPLSFALKDRYDLISWGYIKNACAVFYDNKYVIALPTNNSTFNNEVWVYYPTTRGWTYITDWNIAAFAKVKFSGEEKLYAIDSTDASVYQVFSSYLNNGSAMTLKIESREEDFGQPLSYKVGGEVEVEARATEEAEVITVDAAIDEGAYENLGDLTLTGSVATKLLMHGDGTDASDAIFDDTGRTITNDEAYETALKLMLHCNGTDAGTTFAESSDGGHTTTSSANVYDVNTKLMLHCDGASGATTFTDSIGTHTPSASGDAALDTAQKKFGTAGILFDGTGDFVVLDDHADWNFAAGDFCIDCWVRLGDVPSNGVMTIASHWEDANNQWHLFLNNDNKIGFETINGGVASGNFRSAALSWSTNTWYHIVFSREGTTAYFARSGTQSATSVTTAWGTSGDNAALLAIGRYNAGTTYYFNGWIDEFRITKGTARYNGATYDVPSVAYGQATTDTGEKKFGTASGYFTGDGYITVDDHAD